LKFEDFGDGQSPLCIGADPVSKTRSFKGAIMALVFFDVIVDEDVLAKTALHGITTPPKIVSSSGQFTVDGRSCVGPCEIKTENYEDDSNLKDLDKLLI